MRNVSSTLSPLLWEMLSNSQIAGKRVHGGTGLGLTVAQGLVHLMGGTISAMSRVGSGSIFAITLDLPVAETQTQNQAQVQAQRSAPSRAALTPAE